MDTPNSTTNEAARKSGKHLTLDKGSPLFLQYHRVLFYTKSILRLMSVA